MQRMAAVLLMCIAARINDNAPEIFGDRLRAANKFIVVDHASHATAGTFVAFPANHAALTLHPYIMIAADNVRWQRNFKFDLRSDL